MTKESRYYITLKVLTGSISTLNLGFSTSFLLRKGIGFFELSIIYSLILGTSLAFEYFSGNWADRYGRKKIYAIGLMFTAVQYLFYAYFSSSILLFIAAICGGLGDAFLSGSFEAWFSQNEKKSHNGDVIHKVFSLSRSLSSVFSIFMSLIIGSFLKFNISLFYWSGSLLYIILGLISLLLFEDNRGNEINSVGYTIGSIKTFIKNPMYIFLSIILAVAFSSYSIFILVWQPQAISVGFSNNKLPLIYSLYLIGTAISSDLYRRFGQKISVWTFLLTSFILISISFLLMLFSGFIYVFLLGLFLYGFGFGSIIPIFFTWASRIVDDDQCASLLSLMNGISSLTSVITTIIIGQILQHFSLGTGIIIG